MKAGKILTALSSMGLFTGPEERVEGFDSDGRVRTDLKYIRHLGMPNLNSNVIRTNHKANPIKKRLRKLQKLARRLQYKLAKQ